MAQAKTQDLPAPVLVRDVVRLVEILNLSRQDFFSDQSILAGLMGLRCFGSPRFTVYDADFSTSTKAVDPPTAFKEMLAYRDDELEPSLKVARVWPSGFPTGGRLLGGQPPVRARVDCIHRLLIFNSNSSALS